MSNEVYQRELNKWLEEQEAQEMVAKEEQVNLYFYELNRVPTFRISDNCFLVIFPHIFLIS